MATGDHPQDGRRHGRRPLLRWLKNVGEEVDAGDPIAEIETDKVTLIEAADSGVLAQTLVGDLGVSIGTAIATIRGEVPAEHRQPRCCETAPPPPRNSTQAATADAGNGAAPAAPAPQRRPAAGDAGRGQRRRRALGRDRRHPRPGADNARFAASSASLRARTRSAGHARTGPGGHRQRRHHAVHHGDALAAAAAGAAPAQAAQPTAAAPATTPAAAPSPTGRRWRCARTEQDPPHDRPADERIEAGNPGTFMSRPEVDMEAAMAFREQVNGLSAMQGLQRLDRKGGCIRVARPQPERNDGRGNPLRPRRHRHQHRRRDRGRSDRAIYPGRRSKSRHDRADGEGRDQPRAHGSLRARASTRAETFTIVGQPGDVRRQEFVAIHRPTTGGDTWRYQEFRKRRWCESAT